MKTNAFVEGRIYRSINENTKEPEPCDEEYPEYDCYQSGVSGDFWLGDCWVVDSEGNVHPGYNVSPVPIRRGMLGEVIDR